MARKKQNSILPSFDELIIPTVKALIELGGSGTIEEINTKVYEIAELTDEVLQIPHGEEGNMNEIDYRLAWSKTYLKKFGLVENSSRGVWALLKSDIKISELDYVEIVRKVREQNKPTNTKPKINKTETEQIDDEITDEVSETEEWKDKLLNVLYND
jgi:restriction system protein